jgi:hypothetical protein
MRRNSYRWAAASIGLFVWAAAIANDSVAQAAGIGWEKQGAFQTCLDAQAKAWLDAKVELVVNDDPNAGAINDAAVATWAVGALKECATKAGATPDPASEQQFVKYMAHWHEHIFKAADEIRRRGRPD